MITLSTILIVLYPILLIIFMVTFIVAIVFNFNLGKKYRQPVAKKVHQLRLGKMLNALGIDINDYLYNERMIDIQNQIVRCEACNNIEECDEKLADDHLDASEIDFCNNERSLKEIMSKKTK
ncbi:MAG: DUF6455 family protein [Gammaproteobacteria bacterium]|nr:DUF6455 family protein [Gammaproteobacteria bacterium]